MSEIADFLRARYQEARKREEGVRRMKCPGPFDGHDVQLDSDGHVFIDGHDYPAEEYWETASEPGADPFVLADLDAKLRILDEVIPAIDAMDDRIDGEWGVGDPSERESMNLLRILAQPFAGHPDHKGEEWAP